MPVLSKDFPYGIPIATMIELQSNALAYANNNALIMSSLNLYVASGYSISNPGRVTQHGGIEVSLPNTSALTVKSMMSIRQQMDESNHKMVNMLTQQISTLFNPLIQKTNQSYQLLTNQMG